MAQNQGQINGKRRLAEKEKAAFDSISALIKYFAGKAKDKGFWKPYRVYYRNGRQETIYGESKKDVSNFIAKQRAQMAKIVAM